MNPNRKIDVEKMLSESPAAAPPEDLLEKLKAEIPEEMPETPGAVTGSPTGPPAWMKAAAALLLTAAAGLIGYRVLEQSAKKKTVPIPSGAAPKAVPVLTTADRLPLPGGQRPGVADPRAVTQTEVRARLAKIEPAAKAKTEEAEAKATRSFTLMSETPLLDATRRANPLAEGGVPAAVPAGALGGVVGEPASEFVSAPPPAAVGAPRPPQTITSSAQAPTVLPPSTGGTREPNDAPYGDVFFKEYGTNPFVDTDDDRLSTFGLDVDTGSYTVARRYLNDGNFPPREAVRVEEFINAFSYGDAPPSRGDFAIRAEAAPTPFMKGDLYRVVRFNVRGRVVDEKDRKPAVLTFVVDVSGSMNLENRLELVKKALALLLDRLKPSDRVGLVVYGSEARRLLDPTSDREALRDAISRLSPGGSTNAEDGLRAGYEMAAQFRRRDGINRVILCSDGVANVGRTGPDSILRVIEREAKENEIELTTVGFGMGNYNDVLLEQLANKGDGRYAYVDTLEEARRIFVEELTGTLQTIATDAKVQVEFEPSVVSRWRLIGYENRDIADEKFRDDTVDAGEIGAGHSVTALYEIKLKEDAPRRGTAATLHLRWHSKETGRVVEAEHELRLSEFAGSWDAAPRSIKLASLVAEFGEILKENYWAKDGDLREVLRRASGLSMDERTAEFVSLVERAERLKARKSE